MSISALGASGQLANVQKFQTRSPEALEKGPDRDNDGDEGVKAAKTAASSASPFRGNAVNFMA